MTDDYELPELAEMESMLDEQNARLQAGDKQDLVISLIKLAPYLPFAALLILAFLIS